MAFTIPNEAAAGFADQSELDKVDIDILTTGLQRENAVLSGCEVTPGTGLSVSIASGRIMIDNIPRSISTLSNQALVAADGTNPRFDLVGVNSAGQIVTVEGTPSTNPVFPALVANMVVLAAVYVPANDTTVESNQIIDKRVFVHEIPLNNYYYIENDGGTYRARSRAGDIRYEGTSLVTNILNAIEAAHPTGLFHLKFAPGTFDMGTEWWTITNMASVLIEGSGVGVTIIQNNTGASGSDTEPFSHTNCDHFTYRDFTLSAGGDPQTTSDALDFDACSYCLVERVRITASRARGIVFDGKDTGKIARYNVIRDCEISGTQSAAGDGIEFLGAQYNSVVNCYIHDVNVNGIHITKASNVAQQANKKSSHTFVHNCRIDQAGRDGICILSSDHCIISNNQITNSANVTASRDGIRIETANSISADDNIFIGNTIMDDQGTKTQRYGINILPGATTEANRNVVAFNMVRSNLTGGINSVAIGTRQFMNTDDDGLVGAGIHAFVMGRAGTIPAATADDQADFLVALPFAIRLYQARATVITNPASSTTVTIRYSTDGGTVWQNAGLSVTVGTTGRSFVGTMSTGGVGLAAGTLLNFSITGGGGSGTNLLVEVLAY